MSETFFEQLYVNDLMGVYYFRNPYFGVVYIGEDSKLHAGNFEGETIVRSKLNSIGLIVRVGTIVRLYSLKQLLALAFPGGGGGPFPLYSFNLDSNYRLLTLDLYFTAWYPAFIA